MPRKKVTKADEGESITSTCTTTMKKRILTHASGSKIPLATEPKIKKVKTEPCLAVDNILNTTYVIDKTETEPEEELLPKDKQQMEMKSARSSRRRIPVVNKNSTVVRSVKYSVVKDKPMKRSARSSGQKKTVVNKEVVVVKSVMSLATKEKTILIDSVKKVKGEKGLRERTPKVVEADTEKIMLVRVTRSNVKQETESVPVHDDPELSTPDQNCKKSKPRKGKQKTTVKVLDSSSVDTKMAVGGRKTKKEKEADTETADAGGESAHVSASNKFVGAHVSIKGGLENAVFEAKAIGASSFGLFLKSQRSWKCNPLEDAVAERFISAYKAHGISPNMILPHGSYLLNCGAPNNETLLKSREGLVDELQRCDKLGLPLLNFHPGSTCGEITVEECVQRLGESINLAHTKSKHVTTVIENMSCQGHTLGGKFEELRAIIDQVKDKSRIGVCLDTCHAFAAGYNIATQEGYDAMMSDFENIVGLQYLRAVHLNDSMGDVGCHKDRHENIGKGKIGLCGFERIMNDPRFNNIPMILETPVGESDLDEIKILYSLCKE